MFGEDRHARSSDLVGHVAVGRDAVTAHEAGVDPAVLHDDAGHVVADERDVDAGLLQFKRGQARALEKRPRLVGINVERHSPLIAEEDRPEARAVFAERKRTRVAVREQPVAVL